ncbi:unnamed protein product, partial [Brenthis ino]
MSGSAQEGDGASVEAGPTPSQDLYREKPASTVVRVLTVLAYLLSVSLAAILLSVYYICVWKSPDLPLNESYEMLSARRGDHHDYHPALTLDSSPYNHIGGSNTPVNETTTPPILDSYDSVTKTNDTVEPTFYFNENSTLLNPSNDNETSTTETFNETTVT